MVFIKNLKDNGKELLKNKENLLSSLNKVGMDSRSQRNDRERKSGLLTDLKSQFKETGVRL